MIHSYHLPCPKCGESNESQTSTCKDCPPKEGDYSICIQCGLISKVNEFDILEEITEFELGMMDSTLKEAVEQAREAIRAGSVSIDLGIQDILKMGDTFGRMFTNQMADLRNDLVKKELLPVQALDNVLVQAMVYQLATATISMLHATSDLHGDQGKALLLELRSAFNLVLKKFSELHGQNVKIVTVDINELEKNQGN